METVRPALHGDALVEAMRAYAAASQPLDEWIGGLQALALLRAALDAGVLAAARTPRSPAQIAAAIGPTPDRAADLCAALEAHGIFDRDGPAYRLSAHVAVLLSPDAPLPLRHVLDGAAVKARALAAAVSGGNAYTAMPPEDVLAMAQGIGISALSPLRGRVLPLMESAYPEVAERWRAGACHLEVGCGVGNVLLSLAEACPSLRVVGVEIDPVTAAEARRRAAALNVADRVEIRCLDARDLDDDARFDTAAWSQFFFPAESRAAVLANVRRALKPGGYLNLPMLGRVPETAEERRTPEGRVDALHRLLFRSWAVPVLDERELGAEVAAAGFEVLRTVAGPPRGPNLTRAVLLARRPLG